MRAPVKARDARLNRGAGGTFLLMADQVCYMANLEFRPRAGNFSGDTRAGTDPR
jgi:hypothetical protein